MTEPSGRTDEGVAFSPSRVVRTTAVLVAVGAAGELVLLRSPAGALSLTAAGLVAMINFRWLEVILHQVVQPGHPRFDGWSVLRILGRLALLAGIFAALLWVPKIDAVAVALGFSTLVVALVIEGLKRARVEGG